MRSYPRILPVFHSGGLGRLVTLPKLWRSLQVKTLRILPAKCSWLTGDCLSEALGYSFLRRNLMTKEEIRSKVVEIAKEKLGIEESRITDEAQYLSLIHISEPTRLGMI